MISLLEQFQISFICVRSMLTLARERGSILAAQPSIFHPPRTVHRKRDGASLTGTFHSGRTQNCHVLSGQPQSNTSSSGARAHLCYYDTGQHHHNRLSADGGHQSSPARLIRGLGHADAGHTRLQRLMYFNVLLSDAFVQFHLREVANPTANRASITGLAAPSVHLNL